MNTIQRAYQIAKRDLRSCYTPLGIVAGRDHFNNYWSRDGFWAVFGALELGDFAQAKAHLELFKRHQLSTGQLPVQIRIDRPLWRKFQSNINSPRSIFRVAQLFSPPLDPPSLYIMAIWQYFRHTGEKNFLNSYFRSASKALEWLQQFDRDGDKLLESPIMSDWMDSIMKKGKLSNVNILYCRALESYKEICNHLGKNMLTEKISDLHLTVKQANTQHFWNGQYFIDYIDRSKLGAFSSDANISAILFGTTINLQNQAIVDFIDSHKLDKPLIQTEYPRYHIMKVFPFYSLFGLSNYHRNYNWLWLSSLYALALFRMGNKLEGRAQLARVAEVIIKHDYVGEIYDGKNSVNKLFYRSEVPFAWSASTFIYAVNSMNLGDRRHSAKIS